VYVCNALLPNDLANELRILNRGLHLCSGNAHQRRLEGRDGTEIFDSGSSTYFVNFLKASKPDFFFKFQSENGKT